MTVSSDSRRVITRTGVVVCHKTLDACGVEDPTSIFATWRKALLQHLSNAVFAAQEDAFGVDRHRQVPVRLVRLVHAQWYGMSAFDRDAGVVHEDVKPSESLYALCHRFLDFRGFGDVCFDENGDVFAIEATQFFDRAFALDAVIVIVGFAG